MLNSSKGWPEKIWCNHTQIPCLGQQRNFPNQFMRWHVCNVNHSWEDFHLDKANLSAMRFCKAASIKEPWTIVSLERAYKVLCVIFLWEFWRSGLEKWIALGMPTMRRWCGPFLKGCSEDFKLTSAQHSFNSTSLNTLKACRLNFWPELDTANIGRLNKWIEIQPEKGKRLLPQIKEILLSKVNKLWKEFKEGYVEKIERWRSHNRVLNTIKFSICTRSIYYSIFLCC